MQNKKFTRRVFFLGIIKIFLIIIVVIRLFYLQIRENNYFSKLSDKNRTSYVPIIPKRGMIYDRFNVPIASNVLIWQALCIKSQVSQNLNNLLNSLTNVLNLTSKDLERIIADFKTAAPYSPILIKTNLTQEEIAATETFHSLLTGVFITGVYKRLYELPEATANVTGYIGPVNDSSKNNNTPSWMLGKTGIELSLDSILKGNIGYQKYEVNAKGEVIKKLDTIFPSSGQNITLTIDLELQNYIYNMLKNYSASATVIDIETGEIIAMVSTPSYNPNTIIDGISTEEWNTLINSQETPLINKVLTGLYSPASTLKPAIALLALEKGIIDEHTTLECNGSINIGKDKFHCWYKKGHGHINIEKSLIYSCDVFFYQLALKLSRQDLRTLGENLSFNECLLPLMPYSSKGRLPLEDVKSTVGDIVVSTIGQGEWLATPLHIANMAAMIGNDGRQNELKLLKKMDYKNKVIYSKLSQEKSYLPFSENYIKLVQNALYKVINFNYGTGHSAATLDNEWEISGKTGTAQVVRITEEERQSGIIKEKKIQYRDHAIFMGYLPSSKPKYAISAVMEHAGFAASSVAPFVKRIALKLKSRHPLYEQQKSELKGIFKNAQNE